MRLRKALFILVAAIATIGMAITAASATASTHRVTALTLRSFIKARPSVTCNPKYTIVNVGNKAYSWNDTSSPYTLYFRLSGGTETDYCIQGSPSDAEFVQYGTSRCLYVETSNRTVIEGNCNSEYAKWHVFEITSGKYNGNTQLQSNYNKACLYEDGAGFSATYNPCDSSNANDVFY